MVTWDDLMLSDTFRKNELIVLERVRMLLNAGAAVYPTDVRNNSFDSVKGALYKAFELTPLDKVRVVILGQDPYHGPGQANGLAFSVPSGIPIPPSLRNIFRELQNDLGGELRKNGDLSDWAEQGVLLLNSSLTVEEGKPNSMAELWEPITDEVIRFVDSNAAPVVFVLWGNNAKRKKELIIKNKAHIIESAHPSPLSASRGFLGSKPFSKVNQLLTDNGFNPIVWN